MIYKITKFICLSCIPAASAGVSSHYLTRTLDDKACEEVNTKLLKGNLALCHKLKEVEKSHSYSVDCSNIPFKEISKK